MKRTIKKSKKNYIVPLIILLGISLITNVFFLVKTRVNLPVAKHDVSPTQKTVSRIIDGDTFDTTDGLRIRLAEIDAPEYPKSCYSRNAKERLIELIQGKTVDIVGVQKDTFGRTLGYVYSNKLFINKTLIQEGFAKAEVLGNSEYNQELSLAQDDAKRAKRGMWSASCQTHKNEECTIKGNYRDDTKSKLYHTKDCYNYEKITINTDEKDQWFCTEKEALSAGFTKSQDCP